MIELAKTPSVPALKRGLAILELVAQSRSGLTFSQISRNLAFPRSSIHCLLLTLERQGYVRRSNSTGKYRCSMKLFRIADLALDRIMLREQAAPFLRELAQRTGMTVHMAILEHSEAALVAKLEWHGAPPVATWTGKRLGLHCTSLGKSLIAWLPEAEVERLTRESGMLRHNENTIASLPKLIQELARTRAQGYAVDDEEEELGVRCIGAPVFDPDGRVAAAVSISGTTELIHADNCTELAADVRHAAGQISIVLAKCRESNTAT